MLSQVNRWAILERKHPEFDLCSQHRFYDSVVYVGENIVHSIVLLIWLSVELPYIQQGVKCITVGYLYCELLLLSFCIPIYFLLFIALKAICIVQTSD